tara:strand:+ start:1005 stop:1259 length:255 start_codon:yes stop_codon:yes gene_type:complete
MTPEQFVLWFKGFVQAANTFNITPKQWDTICEYLEKVKEPGTNGAYTIPNKGNYGVTNSTARMDTTYNQDVPTTKTLLTDNIIF